MSEQFIPVGPPTVVQAPLSKTYDSILKPMRTFLDTYQSAEGETLDSDLIKLTRVACASIRQMMAETAAAAKGADYEQVVEAGRKAWQEEYSFLHSNQALSRTAGEVVVLMPWLEAEAKREAFA